MDKLFENEIMEVLYKFQKGYTERNLENVDAYTEELFTSDADLRVMGTSPGEICLGFEQVKEMIEGDWGYWEDFSCDLNNPTIMNLNENFVFVALKACLKVESKYDLESLESQKEMLFQEIKFDNTDSSKFKREVLLLNWILTQECIGYAEKNEVLIPMRITGLLKKNEDKWKFKQMQFSGSTVNAPPNYLFFGNTFSSKARKRLITFKEKCNGETAKIENILNSLQNSWNENEFSGTNMFNKMFDKDKSLLICPEGNLTINEEECIDKLNYLKSIWHEINLDTESSVISTENNIGWALTLGTIKTKILKEKLLKSLLEESKNILESKDQVKQKYITILRRISSVLMIENQGEDFKIPIRVETVFSKEDSWKIKYIQISYDAYWMYEDMIEKSNLWKNMMEQ